MLKINIDKIYDILKEYASTLRVPVVDLIQIQTKDPFKVLVAAILSARTKDKITVNACKKLFEKVKKMEDFDKYTLKDIEKLIFPVGFYRNKAEYLKKLPKSLEILFNSKIPQKVEELIKLPGVGRKTANLVVAVAFEKPAVCVDVHVHRIMNRIGYVKTKSPHQTEFALRKKLPKKYWITFNSIFVAFGQCTCTPVSPFCSKCPINIYCRKIGVKKSR